MFFHHLEIIFSSLFQTNYLFHHFYGLLLNTTINMISNYYFTKEIFLILGLIITFGLQNMFQTWRRRYSTWQHHKGLLCLKSTKKKFQLHWTHSFLIEWAKLKQLPAPRSENKCKPHFSPQVSLLVYHELLTFVVFLIIFFERYKICCFIWFFISLKLPFYILLQLKTRIPFSHLALRTINTQTTNHRTTLNNQDDVNVENVGLHERPFKKRLQQH